MKKAARIQVYGRVQGVGFRFYTQQKAIELNLSGYVQNKSDGSVAIEAEGEAEKLDEFIHWCHNGPSWARVQEVKYSMMPPFNYIKFEIR
ncbi:MAG: acylphosphatase [Bacteroidetes bacterium]|jgi:acylphosphatase|nr:acylphosphatase [Bacteroidota bacterium]MBU1579282.1 acylphosphatase [Bacteroidota bacterium]MBU2464992.1 acylphosphatase [Bacteroidota bacterium]MBU2556466.1 acylphosphatase [Bacteroidota bacterium]MDA3943910.1 acylphosphatase [Bacteroidota bacterium]